MTQTTRSEPSSSYVGKDFVCHTCGCEIMVKHWGDPAAHAQVGVFLCHCGTTLEPESHGGGASGSEGGRAFSEDDFLTQGSGAGGPTPAGETPAGGVAPGGGV